MKQHVAYGVEIISKSRCLDDDIITLQTEEALKEKLHEKLLLFEKIS